MPLPENNNKKREEAENQKTHLKLRGLAVRRVPLNPKWVLTVRLLLSIKFLINYSAQNKTGLSE
jgi:hypothetical protein